MLAALNVDERGEVAATVDFEYCCALLVDDAGDVIYATFEELGTIQTDNDRLVSVQIRGGLVRVALKAVVQLNFEGASLVCNSIAETDVESVRGYVDAARENLVARIVPSHVWLNRSKVTV